jgi:hypothetical protein
VKDRRDKEWGGDMTEIEIEGREIEVEKRESEIEKRS